MYDVNSQDETELKQRKSDDEIEKTFAKRIQQSSSGVGDVFSAAKAIGHFHSDEISGGLKSALMGELSSKIEEEFSNQARVVLRVIRDELPIGAANLVIGYYCSMPPYAPLFLEL